MLAQCRCTRMPALRLCIVEGPPLVRAYLARISSPSRLSMMHGSDDRIVLKWVRQRAREAFLSVALALPCDTCEVESSVFVGPMAMRNRLVYYSACLCPA